MWQGLLRLICSGAREYGLSSVFHHHVRDLCLQLSNLLLKICRCALFASFNARSQTELPEPPSLPRRLSCVPSVFLHEGPGKVDVASEPAQHNFADTAMKRVPWVLDINILIWEFPKIGVPYLGVRLIRILPFRVLY